jgi:hypothetical protein
MLVNSTCKMPASLILRFLASLVQQVLSAVFLTCFFVNLQMIFVTLATDAVCVADCLFCYCRDHPLMAAARTLGIPTSGSSKLSQQRSSKFRLQDTAAAAGSSTLQQPRSKAAARSRSSSSSSVGGQNITRASAAADELDVAGQQHDMADEDDDDTFFPAGVTAAAGSTSQMVLAPGAMARRRRHARRYTANAPISSQSGM